MGKKGGSLKLIVERWVKGVDEATGEEIELIEESVEVYDEEESKTKADEFKAKEGTTKVTLHKCYHNEAPRFMPCLRKEI